MNKFFTTNLLSLNADEIQYMQFVTKTSSLIELHVMNKNKEINTSNTKFLGLTLDNTFPWKNFSHSELLSHLYPKNPWVPCDACYIFLISQRNSQRVQMPSEHPFAAALYKSADWVYCFQGVTPCSLAICYRTFGSSRFFQNGPSIYLQNLGNDLTHYTTPRKAVRFIAVCCENTESDISVSVHDHN
jgi:hypothetical protein